MPRKEQKRVKSSVGSEHGGVAQLGEHLFCTQGVDSSNLFISTRAAERRLDVARMEESHDALAGNEGS